MDDAAATPAFDAGGEGRVAGRRPGPARNDARPGYIDLMAAAADRNGLATLAFAGVIGLASVRAAPYNVAIAGLDAPTMATLLRRYFPGLPARLGAIGTLAADDADRPDEFADLVALLVAHGTAPGAESTWLAHAVATACMEGNHLWQDMGLADRGMLSALLQAHFTPLARRNVGDMKWKKFFYRELCHAAGVPICKSPTCGACVDYAKCFGPEN